MKKKMKIHREAPAPKWEVTCEECSRRACGIRTTYTFATWAEAMTFTAKHDCDEAEKHREEHYYTQPAR